MLQDVYCHTRGSKIYTMTLEATVYQDEVQKRHKLLKILKGSTKDLGDEKLPLVQFGCQNWPTWIEKRPHALLTLQITCRGKTPKTCLGSNHEKTGKTQLWWSIDSFAFRSSKTAPVNARHRLLCMDSIQLRLLLGVESVEGLYRPYIFPKCPTSRLLWCLCTHSNLCIRPLEILVPDFCMNPFRTDVSGLSPVKTPTNWNPILLRIIGALPPLSWHTVKTISTHSCHKPRKPPVGRTDQCKEQRDVLSQALSPPSLPLCGRRDRSFTKKRAWEVRPKQISHFWEETYLNCWFLDKYICVLAWENPFKIYIYIYNI